MTTDVAVTESLAIATRDRSKLDALVRADQIAAIGRALTIAIPVNAALAAIVAFVATYHGFAQPALVWLLLVLAANGGRFVLLRCLPATGDDQDGLAGGAPPDAALERHFILSWLLALAAGAAWGLLPLVSGGYDGAGANLNLIVAAGIVGGAVAIGASHALTTIAFVAPTLAGAAVALVLAGGLDRYALALTTVIYFLALSRSAIQNETAFCEASRLKHEARSLAHSLEVAHALSVLTATEMGRRATHDPLTGLMNRAGFMQEVGRHASGSPYCVFLLDLDGFKSINDVFGHGAGDRVLIEVASRLRRTLPGDFVIARFGGDEFAIFHDRHSMPLPADDAAERLIEEITQPFDFLDAGRIGVSIGIHHGAGNDMGDMLAFADEALYAAKSTGRNHYRVFDDVLRMQLEIRCDIERDLIGALSARALEIRYQPIFRDGGRTLDSLEALLRWEHPRHGWISPTDIIPAAAIAGLSERLLLYILGEVCSMIEALDRGGRPDVRVAMNVSPREMSQLPVDRLVVGRLAEAGIAPSRLEIEITEEVAMDIPSVKTKLENLSAAGVRIAVDDLGIGYASLASLRKLHAGRIKIDRTFVTGLSRSAENRILLPAILALGQAMRLEVVAEGVETQDDFNTLLVFGCPLMQGYHLGRPMPQQAVVETLLAPPAHSASAA